MDLQLAGKVAIVTGGSRGIGRAAATRLAMEGAAVAIVARGEEQLVAAAGDIAQATSARVIAVPADTSDERSVQTMVRRVVEELGGADIVVNAASTPNTDLPVAGWRDLDAAVLAREIDVKVMGYVRVIRAAAPHMIERRWGRIINIAGGAARRVGSVVGSIRNAGVVAMSKNFAAELGPYGINVVAVHPGPVETEATPGRIARLVEQEGISETEARARLYERNHLRRMITADDVGIVIAFVASPLAVGVTGDVVSAGGGTDDAIVY